MTGAMSALHRGSYDNRLAAIDTRLAVLIMMLAGLYAVVVPAAWLLVRIAVQTGAIG